MWNKNKINLCVALFRDLRGRGIIIFHISIQCRAPENYFYYWCISSVSFLHNGRPSPLVFEPPLIPLYWVTFTVMHILLMRWQFTLDDMQTAFRLPESVISLSDCGKMRFTHEKSGASQPSGQRKFVCSVNNIKLQRPCTCGEGGNADQSQCRMSTTTLEISPHLILGAFKIKTPSCIRKKSSF